MKHAQTPTHRIDTCRKDERPLVATCDEGPLVRGLNVPLKKEGGAKFQTGNRSHPLLFTVSRDEGFLSVEDRRCRPLAPLQGFGHAFRRRRVVLSPFRARRMGTANPPRLTVLYSVGRSCCSLLLLYPIWSKIASVSLPRQRNGRPLRAAREHKNESYFRSIEERRRRFARLRRYPPA